MRKLFSQIKRLVFKHYLHPVGFSHFPGNVVLMKINIAHFTGCQNPVCVQSADLRDGFSDYGQSPAFLLCQTNRSAMLPEETISSS